MCVPDTVQRGHLEGSKECSSGFRLQGGPRLVVLGRGVEAGCCRADYSSSGGHPAAIVSSSSAVVLLVFVVDGFHAIGELSVK